MPDLFINDYINKITFLEKQLGACVGYKPMDPFWIPGKGFMNSLRLQGAAKEIADFLKLGQYTFLITVTKQKLNTAGNIELKYSGNDVFVEISEDVQNFEDAIVATLAHELTHKYMQVNGISFGTNIIREYENEVLTDITTIFLGLGKFLLNGCNNERTYQEYRGSDKYEVTKTMKVGYLTQRQIAFVYRLICSMRGISEEDMLSNLNWEAKDVVMGLGRYTKEYFNLDFKSGNYRETIADLTSNQFSQLQNSIDEVEEEINFSESRIRQLRDRVQVIRGKVSALRGELGCIIKSSTHDPCMKFLECIKIEQWKNLVISTVSKKHEEVKSLHKAVRILRKALQKEAKVPEKKQKNKCGIIIVVIAIGLALLLGLSILSLSNKI